MTIRNQARSAYGVLNYLITKQTLSEGNRCRIFSLEEVLCLPSLLRQGLRYWIVQSLHASLMALHDPNRSSAVSNSTFQRASTYKFQYHGYSPHANDTVRITHQNTSVAITNFSHVSGWLGYRYCYDFLHKDSMISTGKRSEKSKNTLRAGMDRFAKSLAWPEESSRSHISEPKCYTVGEKRPLSCFVVQPRLQVVEFL